MTNPPCTYPDTSFRILEAAPFEPVDDLGAWLAAQVPEEPIAMLLDETGLCVHVRAYIAAVAHRPAVLSYADFNMWAQLNLEILYTQEVGLRAWATVLADLFPHRFESKRIIRSDEWAAFCDQYGATGVIGGVIDAESIERISKTTWLGANALAEIKEKMLATYFFSEPNEAMFARVALV